MLIKIFALTLLLPHFFLPTAVRATALPQTSDVVLQYEDAPAETQAKYNYLFTIGGDDTIYPCAANNCSLEPFRDQTEVTMTIYKLPEGYPRVVNIVDQATLAEYVSVAEHRYTIEHVLTHPTNTDPTGRTFQKIQLRADNSFTYATVSQEKNSQLLENNTFTPAWRQWIWPVLGLLVVLGLAGGGWWLWKKKF